MEDLKPNDITVTQLRNSITPIIKDNNLIRTMETDTDISRNISNQMSLLDSYQSKLILHLLAKAKQENNEFNMQTMTFADFFRLINCSKGGNTYNKVFKSLDSLAKMTFIIHPTPQSSLYKRWLSDDTFIDFENKIIKVCLAPGLKDFVCKLKGNYTAYLAGFALHFKGKYTFRLYEYLHSLLNKGKANIPMSDFIRYIANETYTKNSVLIQKVIEPAIREINQKSDIDVIFQETKSKKNEIVYVFRMTDKPIDEKRRLLCAMGFDNKQVYGGYFDKALKNPYWTAIMYKTSTGYECSMALKKIEKPDPNFTDGDLPFDVE